MRRSKVRGKSVEGNYCGSGGVVSPELLSAQCDQEKSGKMKRREEREGFLGAAKGGSSSGG